MMEKLKEKHSDDVQELSTLLNQPDNGEENSESNNNVSFDDIIDSIGGFGHWQRVIFVLISTFDVFAAFSMLLPVFTGAVPNWHCIQYEGSNTTNLSNETTKSCARENHKCIKFEFTDGFTSIVSEWDLVCDLDYISDLVTTLQGVGLMIGAALFGQISDLIGRKWSYFIANVILLLGGFLSGVVPRWEWYAAARVIVGVGFGANMVINGVYPLEFVARQYRVLCGTIGLWSVGGMSLTGLAYLVRNWRHLTLVTSFIGIPAFLSFIILPESPRWLNQHGQYEKAQAVLRKIAEKNKKPVPHIETLKKAANLNFHQEKKRYTYLDLFRSRLYTKRTVVLVILWYAAYLSYYWLAFNLKNLSGNRYLNMLYGGLLDQVAQVSPVFFLWCIGRRGSMVFYVASSLACMVGIITVLATGADITLPYILIILALIGKSMSLGSTYVTNIFSAELYPTVIRNVGVGMSSVSGRVAMVSAPQFVYWSTVSRYGPYIAVCVIYVICIPLTFLLPETRGKPLTDAYPSAQSRTTNTETNNGISTKC